MLQKYQVEQIVGQCQYRDWEARVLDKGDGFLFQWRFMAPDSDTGINALQSCRKWYISPHSTHNEVVRTVHKALLCAVEHEVNEEFKYQGHPIAHPHMSVEGLVEACHQRESRE